MVWLVWLSLAVGSVSATEYVYPVCAASTMHNMYVLYQKSPHHVELWEWNSKTRRAHLALLTRFMPASVALLPDKSGFSFIDNGTIKIKYHAKRSPKTVALDEPLYDIRHLEWIGDQEMLICAKKGGNFGIFTSCPQGAVQQLVHHNGFDCMYPQVKDGYLFYIERDTETWRLKKLNLSALDGPMTIATFDDQPTVFLSMKNAEEGLVLQHPPHIERSHKVITFSCMHITKGAEVWRINKLFSFDVPTEFIFHDTSMRLHESLLPLLPRYSRGTVFFSHYSADVSGAAKKSDTAKKFMRPYRYCMTTGQKQLCPLAFTQQHYFVPFEFEGQSYVGGSLDGDEFEQKRQLLVVDPNDLSLVKIHFPFFMSF